MKLTRMHENLRDGWGWMSLGEIKVQTLSGR